MSHDKILEELEVYLNLDNTEVTELCDALILVAHRSDYCVNSELINHVMNELEEQLTGYQDQYTIETKILKTPDKEYKELVWHG